MEFSDTLVTIALVLLAALAVGALVVAIFLPQINGQADISKRVATVAVGTDAKKASIRERLSEDKNTKRRVQIQESLIKLEEKHKKQKKKPSLRIMIKRAGLDLSIQGFWIFSAITGVIVAFGILLAGVPLIVAIAGGVAGTLGLPRWFIGYLTKRRQENFLDGFADAIDVMVRGLKAGLPITDAMKVIATEMAAPVGPEFLEVVEGQRVGITVDQGVERMVDRMPLSEVNFLAIVMSIQKSTGGNLAEALDNLSHVLRDRKKMKAKIQAVSQEAKASAMIIGSLPFVICGGMMILNPEYLNPMFETQTGHIMIAGSGLWMFTGVMVMRKMINFNI